MAGSSTSWTPQGRPELTALPLQWIGAEPLVAARTDTLPIPPGEDAFELLEESGRSGRTTLLLAISALLHGLAIAGLLSLPQGKAILRKILPMEVTLKPANSPPPPKARPRPRQEVPKPLPARPAVPEPQAVQAPTTGVPISAPMGPEHLPVGSSLLGDGDAMGSVPLDLVFQDEGTARDLERLPTPYGPLRAVYPELARLAGTSGTATIEAFVDETGRVRQVKVLSETSAVFGKAAVEAVWGSRFRPALRLGVPVAISIRIPIRFHLVGEASSNHLEVATIEESQPIPSEADFESSVSPATGQASQVLEANIRTSAASPSTSASNSLMPTYKNPPGSLSAPSGTSPQQAATISARVGP
jgi:TonB family protein